MNNESAKREWKQAYEGIREEMQEIVEAVKACRYCKYLGSNCTPTGKECVPEYYGGKYENN